VRVRTDEPALCACGQRGCVEAYAGTGALLRVCRELGGKCETPLDVSELARAGSAAGLGAFTVMADAIGALIVTTQNILDLDAYVFTGGISRSFDLIEDKMRAYLRKNSYAECLAEVPLLLSGMGARAGVVGAAHLDTRATSS
jgi:predicted NBD/HSP70 family sugar kinase